MRNDGFPTFFGHIRKADMAFWPLFLKHKKLLKAWFLSDMNQCESIQTRCIKVLSTSYLPEKAYPDCFGLHHSIRRTQQRKPILRPR